MYDSSATTIAQLPYACQLQHANHHKAFEHADAIYPEGCFVGRGNVTVNKDHAEQTPFYKCDCQHQYRDQQISQMNAHAYSQAKSQADVVFDAMCAAKE